MPLDISRRKLIGFGLAGLVAAPAIVRAASIMKVRPVEQWADGGIVWHECRLLVGERGSETWTDWLSPNEARLLYGLAPLASWDVTEIRKRVA